MTMVVKFGVEYEALTYDQAVEAILSYNYVAEDSPEAESASVVLFDAFSGGFEIYAWAVPVGEEYVGLGDIFVTPEDAKRLVADNLAVYSGPSESIDAAVKVMEENVKPHDESFVMAYGGWHEVVSYETAVAIIEGYHEYAAEDGDTASVNLALIGDGCEIVAFGSESVLGDSDYITMDVARRLIREGRVDPMVTTDAPSLSDEEYLRLRKEQFGE